MKTIEENVESKINYIFAGYDWKYDNQLAFFNTKIGDLNITIFDNGPNDWRYSIEGENFDHYLFEMECGFISPEIAAEEAINWLKNVKLEIEKIKF